MEGIEFLTGKRAVKVDVTGKTLTLEDGGAITFNKLVIATGARVRTPARGPGLLLAGTTACTALLPFEAPSSVP